MKKQLLKMFAIGIFLTLAYNSLGDDGSPPQTPRPPTRPGTPPPPPPPPKPQT